MDPLNVKDDIRRIEEGAAKMKEMANAMKQAHNALVQMEKIHGENNNLTGIDSFTIGEQRFLTKYNDPAMAKAETHLADAITLYLQELIRVNYERIQNLKDTI